MGRVPDHRDWRWWATPLRDPGPGKAGPGSRRGAQVGPLPGGTA